MAVRFTATSSQGLTRATTPDYNAAYTVLALIYGTTLPNGGTPLTLSLNASNYDQWYVDANAHLSVQVAVGGTSVTTAGTTALSTGTWYCVAYQRVSATQHRMFLGTTPANMAQDGITGTKSTVGRSAADRLDIGSFRGSSNFWNGRVEKVRVFQAELSLDDIKAAAGTMWAEWLLPDATDLTDASGNDRTLTAVGAPTTEAGSGIEWGDDSDPPAGNEFWVDVATGSDAAAGTQAAPWKTIAKVNATTFEAGDVINLRSAGARYPWREELVADDDGAAGSKIVYRSYGAQVTVPTKANASAAPAALRTVEVTTLAELNAAIADMQPGDHIECAAGTYNFNALKTLTVSGTLAAPIVFQGVGPTTIWTCGSTQAFDISANHIQIRDLRLTGNFFGFRIVGNNNIVLSDLTIDNIVQEAISVRYRPTGAVAAHTVYVQNCHIHTTGTGGTGQFGEGVYIGGQADDTTHDVYVLRNHFRTRANAVDICLATSAVWVEGNYIDGTSYAFINGASVAHIDINGTNHTVVNNVIWKGAPIGIVQWGGSSNVIRLNRIALYDVHSRGADAIGIRIVGGTPPFIGADNVVTNIETGGSAVSGGATSVAYGSDTGVTPRPLVLASDMPFIWTADAQSNTYTQAVAVEPITVRFDRAEGNLVASKALVNSERDWFWTGGVLSVYSARYPTLTYDAPGIEYGQRDTAVTVTGDYVTIQGLDLWSGNSAVEDTLEVTGANVTSPDTFVNGSLVEPPEGGPTAAFTVAVTGLSAAFTDASTDDGTVDAWHWDFGDGDTSSAEDPTHLYEAAGNYTVTLTVTDDDDLTANTSQVVNVGQVATYIFPVGASGMGGHSLRLRVDWVETGHDANQEEED